MIQREEVKFKIPTIFECNMIYLIIYVLAPWIFNLLFRDIEIISRVIIIQYFIYLLPIILFLKIKAYSFRDTLKLNKLTMKQIVLISLIVIFSAPFAAFLKNIMITILGFLGKSLPDNQVSIKIAASKNILLVILITAITPGICEETFFRGFLMSSYSKYGAKRAIIFSAVLFGIFHFDIQNLLSTIFIGIQFGYIMYKTNSLIASVIAHATFNSLGSIIQYFYLNMNNNFTNDVSIKTMFIATVTGGIVAALLGIVAYILLKLLPGADSDDFHRVNVVEIKTKGDDMSLKKFIPLIAVALIFLYQIVKQLNVN